MFGLTGSMTCNLSICVNIGPCRPALFIFIPQQLKDVKYVSLPCFEYSAGKYI